MNSREKYKEEVLRQYINPERIEKAPEGFTSKVMTQIQMERIPVRLAGRLRNKSLVPVISVVVTVLLIVAAFLIPGSKTDFLTLTAAELFKNIKLSLPEIDLTSIFSFNLPALLIYVFIGILVLTLLDKALNVLFHREK